MTARLLQHLQTEQAPAVGFVNEAKLYREGSLDPARVDLLRSCSRPTLNWATIPPPMLSLNQVQLDAFEADLLQGETVTRPLMQSEGRTLRWFRHPYLHQGTTPEVRIAFQDFLAAHGYTVGTVTVNNSEWVFAVAYSGRRRKATATRRSTSAQRMRPTWTPCSHGPRSRRSSCSAVHSPCAGAARQRAQRGLFRRARHHAAAARLPLRHAGRRHQGQRLRIRHRLQRFNGESWLELWSRQAGLRPTQQPPVPGFVMQWAGPTVNRGY